jgi:predicted ATPase
VAWEQVAEVFAAALDHPPRERETFLSSACGENSALANEVRSLLENHGSAGDFLEPSSIALGPPLTPSLLSAIEQGSLFAQFAPETLVGNRYRVRSLLGRGGMGDVYEAWDEELAIPVALKTLRFDVVQVADALQTLKQEAMLARAIVHPNVCRVYDLGCHGKTNDGIWFITMEVLRGETLADRLRNRGRFTPEEAQPLVEQLAAGLEAAHQSAVVHLDFKSANVMLVGEPGKEQAVITDFGLARTMRQGSDDRPPDGSPINPIAGTPAYMAPEQVLGHVAGPAADVYALGIVLYELVTGVLPFAGGTDMEVAQRRLEVDPPSPRSVVPDLDERWESVIRRCLEREPRRRFARAGDIAEALAGRLSVEVDAAESAPPIQHSLPVERDRFVGRDSELAEIEQVIAGGTRIVTLLGAGGMGKTRLAVQYGRRNLAHWPGGVWFCDLTEARDLNGIVSAVARSMGVPLGKADPVEQLGHAIAGRGKCIVILDNLEQVVSPATAVVHRWSERTGAFFLLTSRERLGQESVVNVEPLRMEAGLDLFIERAKRLRPGLELDEAGLQAAQEVVRLVEGIPLAIELAGARMRVMTAVQIVAGMRKRFSLLTGGPSERHETLAAAIDGSWELLEPWEKAAFAQCSAFEGGFTLEAVEAVLDLNAYADAPWPVDVIQSLTDKSLLRNWVPEVATGVRLPAPRFGMYVSLQEYARRKLAEDGAVPRGGSGAGAVRATEERHGNWFGRFGAEQAIVGLDQHGGGKKRQALGSEFENLVVASQRAAARGDGETATATYRAAWEVISTRGPYAAAVDLGREVLGGALPAKDRALALITLAKAEKDSGRVEARAHFEEALVLNRQVGSRLGEGVVLGNLGGLDCELGRLEEARVHFEAALAIHREVNDRLYEGVALANLGTLHRIQGRMEEARAHFEAALAIRREIGHRRGEGIVIGNLAALDYEQGRFEEAGAHYEAALRILRDVGDRRWEGIVLGNLGNLYREQGQIEEARIHYEAALAINRQVGNRRNEGIVLGDLGALHHEQGQWEEAFDHYQAALTIYRDVGDRLSEGVVLRRLGDLHRVHGRMDEAQEVLAQGEALLRAVENWTELPKLLCVRIELEYGRGNTALARTLLNEVERLASQTESGPETKLGQVLAKLRPALA